MHKQCVWEYFKRFDSYHMKETGLNGYVYDFLVDYEHIDADDILDIHKYLMKKKKKKKKKKKCLDLLKKCLLN